LAFFPVESDLTWCSLERDEFEASWPNTRRARVDRRIELELKLVRLSDVPAGLRRSGVQDVTGLVISEHRPVIGLLDLVDVAADQPVRCL
jgi:hypothetical protein